ncbi:hypothetical protein X772_35015 [Mesorhizobium sp. LSJC280B00]|nr:hypothetical protein X772_35015 [Mesorhizobium sp. LSJC280B00]
MLPDHEGRISCCDRRIFIDAGESSCRQVQHRRFRLFSSRAVDLADVKKEICKMSGNGHGAAAAFE